MYNFKIWLSLADKHDFKFLANSYELNTGVKTGISEDLSKFLRIAISPLYPEIPIR